MCILFFCQWSMMIWNTISMLFILWFLGEYFKNCHLNSPEFDACIVDSLNAVRPYFKTGLPKYNVAPFDPFYAEEVSVRRGLPNAGFKLTLRNITESGWSSSKVTKFFSDFKNYKVRIQCSLLLQNRFFMIALYFRSLW